MSASMYDFIKSIVPQERILFQEPMSLHTTFRVGGEAACMLLIQKEEELTKLIPYFRMIGQDYFVLGNGSNLLVGDKGYQGIVLKLDQGMQEISVEGTHIRAKAGALLSQTASVAKDHSLSGRSRRDERGSLRRRNEADRGERQSHGQRRRNP